ncbi:MAG: T3SS (YopN, CesT) and YbjN peptide-binding chaperone 1, partial [Nocardioidaceae bacterium]
PDDPANRGCGGAKLSAAGDTMNFTMGRGERSDMTERVDWLLAYVEKCMTHIYEDRLDELAFHPGVAMFREGTAQCHVRTEGGDPAMVRVMAHAVSGVACSAKLLRELNELNARSRATSVWWHGGDVTVECSMFAEDVGIGSLAAACRSVGQVANDIGIGIAAMFDGSTPYPADMVDSSDDAA